MNINNLFISEYIEGSSNNKAIELFNGTGNSIDLTAGNYTLEFYFNGNTTPGTTINLTGTIANDDVFVIADNDAAQAILDVTDRTSTSSFFNGDDAVVLRQNGTIIDSLGQIGFDPGSQWGSGDTSTQNNTLVRLSSITDGDNNPDDSFDPAVEWLGFPQDTFNNLGSFDSSGGNPTPTFELISTIQGSGTASSLEGQNVTVEAIVVGDFQDGVGTNGDLNGFFLQEEDADIDSNAQTSEGIFVFDGSENSFFGVDVAVGDKVQVTGTVTEFNGLTEITNVTNVTIINSGNTLPTATTVNFPLATVEDLEAVEGMKITIPDTLFVTEYFNLDRFGEIRLAANGASNAPGTDGRLDQFTQFNAPDVTGFAAYQGEIAKRQIVLDDGQTVQNPDPIIFGRGGQSLSSTKTLRGGDTVNNLTGILSFGFGDYQIQPVAPVDFQPTNPRPATPEDVGGSLKVASFNVLNFFTTLDEPGNPGSGPNNLSPRGADNQAEFDRQLEKLVTTLETLDADIVGLIELENEFTDTNGDGQLAIDTLVNALNAKVGAGTYAYVDPGQSFVDTGDAISVGAIYKTSSVQIAPGTTVEILTDIQLPSLGINDGIPVFDGSSTNRAPLAVTFAEIATGEKLTIAINHFKSKGGTGTGDNADIGDGQGNFNGTRVRGAEALNAWLNTDPTGSGDSDFLIIGDLNAYAQEDPITTLKNAGYTDLAEQFVGDNSYSFVFDGQIGTLDYGLANQSLASQVTGATEWHINADEPDALDYNLDFGRNPSLFDGTNPFRTSDHDPLIIGLDLSSPVNKITGTNNKDNLVGTEGKDLISGLNRRDTLSGLGGDDTLDGGRGSDVLDGGSGNDTLIGDRGLDRLTGGTGEDTFVFTKVADRIDRITDFEIGIDAIDVSQIFAGSLYDSSTPFEDYISLNQIGANTLVKIDPNGDRFNLFDRNLVVLEGVSSNDLSASDFIV